MEKSRNRAKTVYLNSIVVILTHLFQIVFGFGIRKIFLDTLGVEYLGYNSVFNNILSMLNMADLGVGVAITSFLYKPLAEKDEEKICALMKIYKKIYNVLGIVVLVVGIGSSFFLDVLIPDAQCSLEYLKLLFFINLVGTVSTYYLAYNRTLIIADERTYETSTVDAVIFFLTSVAQIIVLFLFPSYIPYLVITVLKNIISNIILTISCKKRYPFLKNEADNVLVNGFKKPIARYVKDVFVSKIGAYIYYSTANLIISIFKGSILAGILSNYTLVTMQVQSLVTAMLASIQATLGHFLNSDKDNAQKKKVVDSYLFANYYIGNFCFLCIAFLAGPFVGLMFGKEMMLSTTTSFLLGINLMLTIIIQLPSQLFVIYKLYNYDRWIIAISASLNVVISIILVQIIGIDGVLIGTLVTSLIYLFSRMFVVAHFVYKIPFFKDFLKIISYFAVSAISAILIYLTTLVLPTPEGMVGFGITMVVVGIEALGFPTLLVLKKYEFKFLLEKFLPKMFLKNQ